MGTNTGGFRSRAKRSGSDRTERTPQGGARKASSAQRRVGRAGVDRQPGKRSPDRRSAIQGSASHRNPRATALDVLRAVHEDGAFANLALPGLLRERDIAGRDAAFATELTYGTLRAEGLLDIVIAACSSRDVARIDPVIMDILRLGAYQILKMRVEDHAAVDTSVRLIEDTPRWRAKGFANAILREITRTPLEQWEEKLAPEGETAKIAFQTAHPEWIARSFGRVLGTGELRQALEADSARPTVHLVARPGEISAEELALITGGEVGRYSPYAVYLEGGDPGELQPVRDHLAGVQDEGSQIIARALTEAPLEGGDGGRWLDLCAGPGGKSALVAAIGRIDGAHLDAVEIAPHRARLVEQATQGLPVAVHVADGRDPGLRPGFDRVLVDAPCSGLGALRRRPEARWRKSEADIEELRTLQFELLRSAAQLTRPGGVVVYSTCSPDLRETREVVDRALSELSGLTELPAQPLALGMEDLGEFPSAQMWPHRHGTDAMFFAVLRVGQ